MLSYDIRRINSDEGPDTLLVCDAALVEGSGLSDGRQSPAGQSS